MMADGDPPWLMDVPVKEVWPRTRDAGWPLVNVLAPSNTNAR